MPPQNCWRERTKALMRYYSPTKNKLIYQVMIFGFLVNMENTIAIDSYPFSQRNNALPLNSLFWSPPTAVHRFDAWDMEVSGLYISCIVQRSYLADNGECSSPFPSTSVGALGLFTFLPQCTVHNLRICELGVPVYSPFVQCTYKEV